MMTKSILSASIAIISLGITQSMFATTINNSVDQALNQSPKVLSQRYQVMADNHFIRQKEGLYWPTIDLSGGIGRELADNTTTRADGFGNNKFTAKEGSFKVSEKLWDGGSRASQVAQKQSTKASDDEVLLELKNAVALDTADAYMNVLREKEIVKVYQTALKEDEQMVASLEKGVARGASRASDAQLMRSMTALNKSRLQEAQTRLSQAENAYEEVVGEMPGKNLLKPAMPDSMPKTAEAAWEIGKVSNPSILSSKFLMDNARQVVDEKRAAYYPEFDLDGEAKISDEQNGVVGVNKLYKVMLNMDYNLYNGGSDQAEVQGERSKLTKAHYDLDETVRQVKKTLNNSYVRFTNGKQLMVDTNDRREETGAVVKSFEKEFQLGNKNFLDVVTAKNDHNAAQVEAINAYYANYINAYAVLADMGKLVEYFSEK